MMHKQVAKFMFWLTGVVILILGGWWAITGFIWSSGKQELSLQLFPFDFSRAKILAQSPHVSDSTKQTVLFFYQQHPDIARSLAETQLDSSEGFKLYLRVLEKNPFDWETRRVVLQKSIKENQPQIFLDQVRFFEAYFPDDQFIRVPENVLTIIKNNIFYLSRSTSEKDLQLAMELYLTGAKHWPWLMVNSPISFLEEPQRFPKEKILYFLHQLDHQYLWPYQASLIPFYLQEAELALTSTEYAQVGLFVSEMMKTAPWRNQEVWLKLSVAYDQQYRQNFSLRKYEAAAQILISWRSTFDRLDKTPTVQEKSILSEEVKLRLTSHLAELSTVLVKEDLTQAVQLISLAQTIEPWVIYRTTPFFFKNDDPRLAEEILKIVLNQDSKEIWIGNYRFIKTIQLATNYAIQEQRWSDAEKYLQTMQDFFLDDHLAPAQIGNFYYWRGQHELAKKSYEDCLLKQQEKQIHKNTGCTDGLTSLQENWQDGFDRYWQTSQEILEYGKL